MSANESVNSKPFVPKAISFQGIQGRTNVSEALNSVEPAQIEYYNEINSYVAKFNVVKYSGKYRVTYRYKGKPLIKLYFKRGYVTVSFLIEDERLRKLKRSATARDISITEKESELSVDSRNALDIVMQLVDMRISQIDEDLAYQREQKKAAKKAPKTEVKEKPAKETVSDSAVISAKDLGAYVANRAQQSAAEPVIKIELLVKLVGMAYKPPHQILDVIGDTVEIQEKIHPIYNFKAC